MLMIDRGEDVVIGLMGIRDESGIPNARRHRAPGSPDDLAIVPMAERA